MEVSEMHSELEDLSPEEKLERIVEILTKAEIKRVSPMDEILVRMREISKQINKSHFIVKYLSRPKLKITSEFANNLLSNRSS